MLAQIKDVENSLPFPLLGFDTDNGNEFLNWHLFRHFTPNHRKPPRPFFERAGFGVYPEKELCSVY